jgi:hypothetical protein
LGNKDLFFHPRCSQLGDNLSAKENWDEGFLLGTFSHIKYSLQFRMWTILVLIYINSTVFASEKSYRKVIDQGEWPLAVVVEPLD